MGLLGALSVGIGGIVGGGIFATIGLAAVEAQGAAWLSFLVGGVLALLTAYAYVRLTLAFPGPGGTVTFIGRAFGEGLLAAGLNTLLVFSYVMVMALYAIAFANYGRHFVPEGVRDALAPGVIVVLALVNLVGPRLVERSEGVLNLVKLAILAVFIVAGLASPSLTLAPLGPAHWVGPGSVVAVGMLVFLSYEGFELIANASGRITDPARTLPIAYYGSVLTAIVLYVLMVVVTLGHLPAAEIARSESYALAAAAQTFMGGTGFMLSGHRRCGRRSLGDQRRPVRGLQAAGDPGADRRGAALVWARGLGPIPGRPGAGGGAGGADHPDRRPAGDLGRLQRRLPPGVRHGQSRQCQAGGGDRQPALAERARGPAVPGGARGHARADGAKQRRPQPAAAGRGPPRPAVRLSARAALAAPAAARAPRPAIGAAPRPGQGGPAGRRLSAGRLSRAALGVVGWPSAASIRRWKPCRRAPPTPTASRAARSMSGWSAARTS